LTVPPLTIDRGLKAVGEPASVRKAAVPEALVKVEPEAQVSGPDWVNVRCS